MTAIAGNEQQFKGQEKEGADRDLIFNKGTVFPQKK